MVRAKFKVDSIERAKYYGSDQELQTIKLSPVGRTKDPEDENSKFFASSPSGHVQLGCVNPEAAAQFELGKEYYLTFAPAN